jgi:hypothetical protein
MQEINRSSCRASHIRCIENGRARREVPHHRVDNLKKPPWGIDDLESSARRTVA